MGGGVIYVEQKGSTGASIDASFSGVLSPADDTLQKSLNTLDQHKHDSRYYTESETDILLLGKSSSGHIHSHTSLTDIGINTHIQIDSHISNLGHLTPVEKTDLTDGGDTTLHIHDTRYYTENETDILLATKSISGHIHDDRYYTETELDSGKLDNRYYTETETDAFLLTKSSSGHVHDNRYVQLTDYSDLDVLAKIENVDGSGSGLDADMVDGYHSTSFSFSNHLHDDRYYTENETDILLLAKSPSGHIHDDRYYTEGEVDVLISLVPSGYVLLSDYTDINVLTKIENVDGTGSGLDADMVDGQHGSYYSPTTHNHSLSNLSDVNNSDKANLKYIQWDASSNKHIYSTVSTGSLVASGIITSTDNFNTILSISDTNVQKALETIDDHTHTTFLKLDQTTPQTVVSGQPNFSSGIYINETANTKLTTGLTINQGSASNEIISLKSSDVAHGVTSLTETDTFCYIKKSSATAGGTQIVGLSDADTNAIYLKGMVKATPSTGAIKLEGSIANGTNEDYIPSTGIVLSVNNWSGPILQIWGGGNSTFNYNAQNTKSVTGITISQSTYDDEILSLKSSDVAHGITTNTETDTYSYHKKLSATLGGLQLVGLSDGDATGIQIEGIIGSTDPTDTTPAVILMGRKKSGTTTGALDNSETILRIDNHTTTGLLSLTGNGNLDVFGTISGSQLISDISDGSSPIIVISTTKVTNLNADYLDGYHATSFAPFASGVINGNLHDHSGGDGAQIDHTTLSNIGTLSHTTIDSYLNQAVKTTSSPTFNRVTLSTTPFSDSDAATKKWVDDYFPVQEDNLFLNDVTTLNASSTQHGFLPRLSNNANQYLNGAGNFSLPTAGTSNDYSLTTFDGQTSVIVLHNFGSYPLVQVLTNAGVEFIPYSITHNNLNQFTVVFSESTSGSILATLGSPQKMAIITVSDNYSVLVGDRIVEITASGKTITLPSVSGNIGHEFVIDNNSSGNTTVIVSASGIIQGEYSQTLPSQSAMNVFANSNGYRIY